MWLDNTGYSGNIYSRNGIRDHANFVNKKLAELKGQFDFVAVTGKSGMSVAFAALALGEEGFDLVTVRKQREKSHGSTLEGLTWTDTSRYVVIDDTICSGDTLNYVHETIAAYCPTAKMVGVLLYAEFGYDGTRQYLREQDDGVPIHYSDVRVR